MPNNQTMYDQLQVNIYGIPIGGLIIFFVIILSTFVVRSIFLYIIDKKVAKLRVARSEVVSAIINAIKDPLGYLILTQGFYLAIISLQLPEKIGNFTIYSVIHTIYILAISFTVLYFAFRVVDIVGIYIDKKVKDKNSAIDEHVAQLITKSLQILIATIGILSILNNFGYNVATLVAGLGLGGLAFALAAQTTISNLFGSATIFSDKPFRVGDNVQIGDVNGIVEEIGLRSTRIRRSDQALAIVPNSKFVNSEIINYSVMTKRKIEFYLKVTQNASSFDIKHIVNGIKKIIEEDERFEKSSDIVRFTDFGDWSFNIYVYSLVKTTDNIEFQEIREYLNIEIMRLLDSLDMSIAHPSQTIYMCSADDYGNA